jgi:hypothetical protein
LNEVFSGKKDKLITAEDVEDIFPEIGSKIGLDTSLKITLESSAHPELVLRPGWAGNALITMPAKFEIY